AQFGDHDARLLELIGDRIALAISQVTLFEAERAAQERLQFLAEASTVLASSLDVEATLGRVARLAVPHFADWCAVDLVGERDVLNRVAVAYVDQAKVGLAERLVATFPAALDDNVGIGAVVHNGEPEVSAEAMIVPLVARGRRLGALTFVFAES